MHWLDRVAVYGSTRLPPQKRSFHLGWGDEDLIEAYLERVKTVPPVEAIDVRSRPSRRSGGTIVRDLEFESPHDLLGGANRTVRARWISPVARHDRIVLLHAAWNDEGYETRSRLARDLLKHGIASVLPQHPFYGDRRVIPPDANPIATVSDFCLMGRAAVLEGRALVHHLAGTVGSIGVAGYSMGGNIAGFVGSTVDVPVAVASIAASYSPGPVFSDGILRHTIRWEALGGDTPEIRDRLWSILGAASILDFDPPPHLSSAVLVAGTKDGFVPNATTLALHRHWPGSEMEWVTAGHASLLWRNRDRMEAGIVRAFDRRDAAHVRSGRGAEV